VNAELDHVFILCSVDAPEAVVLTQLGFKEGSANTHPGQGTACRRFFFRTSYLELVWVHSPEEVQSETVRRTALWERWSGRLHGACPFGIVLRPSSEAADVQAPFPAWSYRPSYLPPGLSIEVASDVPLSEPAFFWLPFRRSRAQTEQPTAHQLGQMITSVRLGAPIDRLSSDAARAAEALGLLAFERCSDYVVDLTLDGGILGETSDLRPGLPMRLRR
jgi:hypothetical protein